MLHRARRQRPLLLGLALAFAASIIVAVIATVIDWWKNPSGLFHGPEGTQWRIVFDTFLSWWIPGFLYLLVVVIAVWLLGRAVSWARRGRTKAPENGD
ncbi:MAG: hypothetical protein SX243_13395 [Acidobacteriota bacterium]|nr:hypothetical protein [Acidobacteriota bacterium]